MTTTTTTTTIRNTKKTCPKCGRQVSEVYPIFMGSIRLWVCRECAQKAEDGELDKQRQKKPSKSRRVNLL